MNRVRAGMNGVLARLGFRYRPEDDGFVQMVDLEANENPPGLPARTCLQTLKENKLKVLIICLLVVVLALSIDLAVLNSQRPKLQAVAVESGPCLDAGCLWVGAQRVAAANTSVSPCDNFFQYACGGHRDSDPALYMSLKRNLTTDKLHEMLLDQPEGEKEDSADSKLRRLYRSCLRGEARSQEAARKVLGHLQQMGGWWLVPNWNASSFDLQHAMQYSYGTLDTDVFWEPSGVALIENTIIIAISPRPLIRLPDSEEVRSQDNSYRLPKISKTGGLGCSTSQLPKWKDKACTVDVDTCQLSENDLHIRNFAKGQILFKEYVASITKLYLRDMTNDAGENATENIHLFVSDVVNMRQKLQNSGVPSSDTEGIEKWHIDHTLFPENPGKDLDWPYLVHAKLGVWRAKPKPFAFIHAAVSRAWVTLLKSMVSDEEKRMLNSYIVWQILENFIIAMPLEYRNVKETFEHKVGWGDEEDRRESCQLVLMHCLPEPLGSLYTRHYSETKSKQMVIEMAELMREEFMKDITKYPWMDEATKKAAIYKVRSTDIVVEYPEMLKNETLIDQHIEGLQVRDDALFIDNYAAAKAFQHNINSRLMNGLPLDFHLAFRTFLPDIWSPPLGNLLGIPVLELPVFGTSLPMHVNMASVGSKLGYSLDGLIKEYGGIWMDGSYIRLVLSSKSQANWLHILEQPSCLDNLTSPAPPQPWNNSDSYLAYKTWREQHASVPEKVIPGISLTPDQSFFMTYAQMKCSMKREIYYGTTSTPDRVNFALSQLPEFAEAFRCGRSPMNPEDKCVLKILQPSQTKT